MAHPGRNMFMDLTSPDDDDAVDDDDDNDDDHDNDDGHDDRQTCLT